MYPNTNNTLPRISEVLSKVNSGIIAIPNNPSVDAIAAATALYLGLNKIGKNCGITCSSPVKSDLIGADKIQNTLTSSGDNLVISFPYADGAIDKVDYNIQNDAFNMIISPRPGQPKLDPNQVKYSYSGGLIDFIFTIDAPNLNSLGQIYNENQAQFQGKNIINIDRHITNGFFGSVNYVNKTVSSTCELILKVSQQLGIEFDKDISTNLYFGITTATNNFSSYSVTADTFAAAAQLLKNGAVKKAIKSITQPSLNHTGFTPPPPFRPTVKNINTNYVAPTMSERDVMKPIENVEITPSAPEGTQTGSAQSNAPQDWLKPKIFRGGGLI